jgi:aspartate kinase
MIVMKFGGTSVKDAEAIDRACRIVHSRLDRAPLVVVSALSGVTSGLLEAARLAGQGAFGESMEIFERLCALHLGLMPSLETDLNELKESLREVSDAGRLSAQMEDQIASYGERLSSQVIANRLSLLAPTTHVDARKCLITDDKFGRANPILEDTTKAANAILRPLIQVGSAVVMGGYVASTRSGETSTLGRGGSDYSATLFASCLEAEEVEIWTDVDGMMTADPRVVEDALTIRHISFAEASELAYFGAKVLHPSTVLPAIQKAIPVRVLNSRRPEGSGTVISSDAPAGKSVVKSFATKRPIVAVTITSSRMLMAHGFLRALFEVFDKHRISIDVVTTSEVSVSLTTDDSSDLESAVEELASLGKVEVERGLALVCMVGTNLKDRPGIAAQTFACVSGINIRMISQGASEINISFVVGADHADTAIRLLHDHFFASPDPDIFEKIN